MPAKAHDPDYRSAVSHATSVLDGAVPAEEMARVDAFLREQSRLPLDVRYSAGQPWGGREEQLRGRQLAAGLDFAVDAPGDCWDDLARGLVISESNLRGVPAGIAVSDAWLDRVAASAEAQGSTWLHALILATAALDLGDTDGAREHATRSLSLQPSWAAYRLRALATADFDAASASYRARVGDGQRAAGTRRRDRHAPDGRRSIRRAQGLR